MFGRNCQKKEDSVRKKSGPRKLLFSSSFDDGNFNAECLVTPGSLPVSGSSTTTTTPQAETPPAFRRPNGRRSLGRPFGLSVDRTDGRTEWPSPPPPQSAPRKEPPRRRRVAPGLLCCTSVLVSVQDRRRRSKKFKEEEDNEAWGRTTMRQRETQPVSSGEPKT